MSDATGGMKYTIFGAVAYLRLAYQDGTFGWIQVAACSKITDEGVTIVIKELKGVKLATVLAKRVSKCLDIPKENVYYYADNTIFLDQLEACKSKDINGLSRGIDNLIAKIINIVPA